MPASGKSATFSLFLASRRLAVRLPGLTLLLLRNLTRVRRDSGRQSPEAWMAWAVCLRAGEPGKVVVGMGRWIGRAILVIVVAPSWGCAHGPRASAKFRARPRSCGPGQLGWGAGRPIRA